MPDQATAPPSTFSAAAVLVWPCPHCELPATPQLVGGSGMPHGLGERACLQCIADGRECCSLAPLKRG